MVDTARARRLAKRIMAIVATEVEHQVKDPRLAMVTITSATVSPDLRDAVVYYTVYGDDVEVVSSAIALASATGVLRSAVGRQTGIRFTPTLEFRRDMVPEHSRYIEDLLVAARASDAAVAERAAGASFAGEPDPYRQPRDFDADDAEDFADEDSGGEGAAADDAEDFDADDAEDFDSDELAADELAADGSRAEDGGPDESGTEDGGVGDGGARDARAAESSVAVAAPGGRHRSEA